MQTALSAESVLDASNACNYVASALAKEFPSQVFGQTSTGYATLQQSYWSGCQKDLRPSCFFQPHSASEVATAVQLCVRTCTPFGIKSGGHGHYAGQSCLDGGIQLDLVTLNQIEIDAESGTALVGTGCTWRSVYTNLQREGFMAVGGRSADVGVGGFLLGGGISFYAARLGWGIDNVRAIEVVLPSGEIARASQHENSRLFRAMRGGGPNFGVITSFELELVPYSGMWGGRTTIDSRYAENALEAYVDFVSKLHEHPKGHTIIIFDYYKGVTVRQYLAYTEPKANLPIFDRLRDVPTVDSNLGFCDYTDLAADIAQLQEGHGLRHAVSTLTVRLDLELLKFVYETYVREAEGVKAFAAGCLEFHALPISPDPSSNVYGLKSNVDPSKPLVAIMLGFSGPHRRYDYTLIALQQKILGKVKEVAEVRGLYHPFLFANYAGPFQDVVNSYSEENVRFLAEVAAEVDPGGVMQELQPGGFKLGAARLKSRKSRERL